MRYPFSILAVFNDSDLGFSGNTAAVILSNQDFNDRQMQEIAADINQPATSFIRPMKETGHYGVRWFAPDAEIDLCGHGSLAVIAYLSAQQQETNFSLHYQDGIITGSGNSENAASILLDAIPVTAEAPITELLQEALGSKIIEHYSTNNKNIVVLENANAVKGMNPDFAKLRQIKTFGYAVTAAANDANIDFVSRTLVPHVKQLEDPATGSSHAALVPFWAKKLNKSKLIAHQLSKRGGKFICATENNTVRLQGNFSEIVRGEFMR